LPSGTRRPEAMASRHSARTEKRDDDLGAKK
jgi:hypothetical protein